MCARIFETIAVDSIKINRTWKPNKIKPKLNAAKIVFKSEQKTGSLSWIKVTSTAYIFAEETPIDSERAC